MKNFIIIFGCLILSFFIYKYIWDNWEGVTVTKHYKYYGCNIKFKHIVFSPQDISISKNIYQSDSANCALIICLLQKYKEGRDNTIENFIFELYKEGNFEYNFINRVVHIDSLSSGNNEFYHPSIDTLIKYQNVIFTYRSLSEIM
jgi:hypothetical protein